MAKKAPALDTIPKPGTLDLWHKGLYPLLYLCVVIFFGSFTLYFGLAKLAADREVDRLKAEVIQCEKQEQRAKDDAQWLRVEIAKDRQREKTEQDDAAKSPDRNDPKERARLALMFAGLRVELDALQNAEAMKFGEEVKDMWERAAKKAAEEVKKEAPIDWSKL